MMTVITEVTLREGSEPEWDRVMADRLSSAADREGWIRSEILMPLEEMNNRVIVGTWRSRADWEAWHQDPAFTETSARLDTLQAASRGPQWHEVVVDATDRRALRILKSMTSKTYAAMTQTAARMRASKSRSRTVAG